MLPRTVNGGITWSREYQTPAVNAGGQALHFMSRSRGVWVATFVYATTDGGKH